MVTKGHMVQVRGGQLWGTDIYTNDSDLVAGMPIDFFFFLNVIYPNVNNNLMGLFWQFSCILVIVAQHHHLLHPPFLNYEQLFEFSPRKIVSLHFKGNKCYLFHSIFDRCCKAMEEKQDFWHY